MLKSDLGILIAVVAFSSWGTNLSAGENYRGISVLSSSIGKDVPGERVVALAKSCRLNLVVIDFAWITHHWPRTTDDCVELADRLQSEGVNVALMFRPRTLRIDIWKTPANARQSGALSFGLFFR